jgi:hypothetical protein
MPRKADLMRGSVTPQMRPSIGFQATHALVCLRLALGAPATSAGRTASTPKIERHRSRDMNSFLARCSGRRAPAARA